MFYYERKLKVKGYNLIIGVDEAGRGPLAGPVVAAAVYLKTKKFKHRIDDSKKLTPLARERAFLEITGKAIFGIGIVNEKIIDEVNIFASTRMAMENAVSALLDKINPAPRTKSRDFTEGGVNKNKNIHILVDGNLKLNTAHPVTNIIRGDSRSKSIASASILAKVTRDRIMDSYDKVFPQYGFAKHKGYPTKSHRMNLKKFGPCLIHRRSFAGVL